MSIESEQDLEGLKAIGYVVALTLHEMSQQVRPGITTAELDAIGAEVLARHGARSAPQRVYDFPGATCISLNEVAAHGIPGDRVIREGDLVNIDVSAEMDGYFGDTAATVPVMPVTPVARQLADCARHARDRAIAAAQAGARLSDIGRASQTAARRGGFHIIRNLPGHGIGRTLHEEPWVLGFYSPASRQRLTEGLVITVEPFLSVGATHVVKGEDGWTLRTSDGSLAAQYEHTIVVRHGEPLILTAL